jgi:hypothetical protein
MLADPVYKQGNHAMMIRRTAIVSALMLFMAGVAAAATPNLEGQLERPLRYRPDGMDFVISNGPEFFNRPLYGGNTAFRADAGDKPEFVLYVPGRGGNLRLGIRTAGGAKWLNDAAQIETRYRPGEMLYQIRDPMLGNGVLRLAALGLNTTEGLIVRVQAEGVAANQSVELIWAFGGANGDRGSRSGDIGAERVPVSEFFAFRPAYARNNKFAVQGTNFTLERQPAPAAIAGVMPAGSELAIADGNKWASATDLLASAKQPSDAPVIVGHCPLSAAAPLYLSLQRLPDGTEQQAVLDAPRVSSMQEDASTTQPLRSGLLPMFAVGDLPRVFDETEAHFKKLREQVVIDTPDPYINAAMAALNIAADAIWDAPQQAVMHGGVAWRTKLLGWRGPYFADALGYHDRIEKHLANWFPKQNTDPIDTSSPGPDRSSDLARSEAMLHTNGDLTRSHYDMNMVAVDAFFRHALWTGDLEYVKANWPVIERHLAWERRLFRREFGPEKLPLYEAYAAIWASDDLYYSGGGATHTTAYNYWHHLMAARIAKMIGEDPAPYQKEADLIHRAMNELLWMPEKGWFAENKDLLGKQLIHPMPAVWTNYHTIDSHAADPFQAWQMGRYIDTQIPHLPLQGPGVPEGYFNLSTSTWMPYTWSINNVAMAETVHTAFSQLQAGQTRQGLAAFKGAILDSMFMGLCPGNVHMASFFDPNRKESQRDSGDPIGITARTFVEGLFGIQPDALAGEVTIQPAFPLEWDRASIKHPDLSFSYTRDGQAETYTVEPHFRRPMATKLMVHARAAEVAAVTVNGQAAQWHNVEAAIGTPVIEINAPAAERSEIKINWRGDAPATVKLPAVLAVGSTLNVTIPNVNILETHDPQKALINARQQGNSITATVGSAGDRTVFAKVKQGEFTWWEPLEFQARPAFEIIAAPVQDAEHLRFRIRNNTGQSVSRDVEVKTDAKTASVPVKIAANGESDEISIPANGLLPGSHRVVVAMGDNTHADGMVVNWNLKASAPADHWQTLDLTSLFNDSVTQIFKNRYLSPRSPYTSLSIPADGIGGWATFSRTAEIDDSGLRAKAAENGGKFMLQEGIPFATPGADGAKNIAFVSQWDNHPREIAVPATGKASHVYLLMAGSTNHQQSRFENGEVVVSYADGTTQRLSLENPTTWWPIERDYFTDDYSFRRPEPVPPRVNLRSGEVRIMDPISLKGGRENIAGGAATVLDLPLDAEKELQSLTVRSIANESIIGLMGVTLAR